MERVKSNEKAVRNLSLENNSGVCLLFLSYALNVKFCDDFSLAGLQWERISPVLLIPLKNLETRKHSKVLDLLHSADRQIFNKNLLCTYGILNYMNVMNVIKWLNDVNVI